jgi:hypothetical protein
LYRDTTGRFQRSEHQDLNLGQAGASLEHIGEIIQLHQGKSSSHHGPMSVDDIASKFRLEAATVQNTVQFVSLPQDEDIKKEEPE